MKRIVSVHLNTPAKTSIGVCSLLLLLVLLFVLSGCEKQNPQDKNRQSKSDNLSEGTYGTELPCSTQDEMAIFAKNSPFNVEYNPPGVKAVKRLWARSILWEKAPELVIGKWLTEVPDIQNKCVLIEFWATWCGPCRRSVNLLNSLHEKYGDELVVIGISDETEQEVKNLVEPEIKYYSAIDTQARMKNALWITAVPHIIIIESKGSVVWEGFPFLKDYQLTEEVIEQILKVARTQKEQTNMEETK